MITYFYIWWNRKCGEDELENRQVLIRDTMIDHVRDY